MKSVIAGLFAAASLLAVASPSSADSIQQVVHRAHARHVHHKRVCTYRHHHRVCHYR